MTALGLDIGGANLKAASADGRARAVAFPLWKSPDGLAAEVSQLVDQFRACTEIAVTMTGELADCYATKSEGVSRILTAVEVAAGNRDILVWTTDGQFVTPVDGRTRWSAVAAANWHALATWAGQFAPKECALLIDIGSTTTDLIPLRDGVPCAAGQTDYQRMRHGELVYTGVRRTPLCAVDLIEPASPLAAELFGTMLDAHLITHGLAEDAADRDTADGRPATRACALNRLARMRCCDRTEQTERELIDLAWQFVAGQSRQIATAIQRVIARQFHPPRAVLISGSGAFLARRIVANLPVLAQAAVIDLESRLSPAIAESACAHAVACLCDQARGR